MRDFDAFKRATVKYWERRRIIYNLALAPPAFLGYAFTDALNWVGDPHDTHFSFIVPLFAFSAIGANVCYSFCYTLEFRCGSDHPKSRWMRFGRKTVFVGGLLIAMFLAFYGGTSIAMMEWEYGVEQHGSGITTHD